VRSFEAEMHRYFRDERPELRDEIREKKEISAELEGKILEAMQQAREHYFAEQPEAKVA
jgi:F0F1-type ATP synthase alpha subunit